MCRSFGKHSYAGNLEEAGWMQKPKAQHNRGFLSGLNLSSSCYLPGACNFSHNCITQAATKLSSVKEILDSNI